MERVSVIQSENDSMPILLIAPHGASGDDEKTAELTEKLAEKLDCYAVINRGFERADKVDYFNDKADCNNVNHLQEDVIREEFLESVQKCVGRIHNEAMEANIFLIHGMANPKTEKFDMVIGYGASESTHPSYSCDIWRKDAFLYTLSKNSVKAYVGKAGGRYSGARKSNLNQYYRSWEYSDMVHSMQIEIIKSLREDEMLETTAHALSEAIEDYVEFLEFRDNDELPKTWPLNWQKLVSSQPSY